MHRIAPYAKAIVGALVAGLGSLYQALDGDPSVVTSQEWIAIAMTTLAALGVVFTIPNRDPRAEHQDESVQPPNGQRILGKGVAGNLPHRDDRGASDVATLLVVCVAALLIVVILTRVL